MKLKSFSVQKYRSISSAQRIHLDRVTTLVGPNNEGKSNILRALVLGMRQLSAHMPVARPRPGIRRRGIHQAARYDWERDFPKSLQDSQPNGRTILDFEFELDEDELQQFRDGIGSSLNGLLPIRLMLDRKLETEVKVRKQGPGGTTLTKKADKIFDFVRDRIRVQYVPAIRTADEALSVVGEMVEAALSQVEESDEYKTAVEQIAELQQPILQELSLTIRGMLNEFLPDVVSVDVRIPSEARFRGLRASAQVLVDDGTETDLELKGDGVQSLAALALMRRASETAYRQDLDLILAIEEPEAHLHPSAIHQLKGILEEVASRQQVIITTHSPLLANRVAVASNIIVGNNEAKPAGSIAEVRSILGVRISDNLATARLVLVVEGEDDARSLRAIFCERSKELSKHIEEGSLAIDWLGGSSNLSYKLSQLRSLLCAYHTFLDHDDAGLEAEENARNDGLLRPVESSFATCRGMRESELEDLYDVVLYEEAIREQWGVSLTNNAFRNSRSKWSSRMGDAFRRAGKRWNDREKQRVKNVVASQVELQPGRALNIHKSEPIDALTAALVERLTTA